MGSFSKMGEEYGWSCAARQRFAKLFLSHVNQWNF